MSKLSKILTAAALIGATAMPLQTANAWGGPWGGNMFGMDMGQSTGGYGYPGYGGPGGFRPWGGNMFGMDMGQSTGYGYPYYGGGWGYPGYRGW
jgi:hypothetical protein